MRTFLIRGLAVAASTLVLAACYEITPHRYESGNAPNTVRIGAGTSSCGFLPVSLESESTDAEQSAQADSTEEFGTDAPSTDGASAEAVVHHVDVLIDGVSVGSATPDSTGSWSVDVPAPTDIGTHIVTASCDGSALDLPSESSFNEIIVEPPFDPTADHPNYTVSTTPDSITFSGRFCINSTAFQDVATGSTESSTVFSGSGDVPPIVLQIGLPTVTVDFNGTKMTQIAQTNQPYDEVWHITFPNPPNAVGTYTAHVECGYDDLPNIADASELLSSLSSSFPESTLEAQDLQRMQALDVQPQDITDDILALLQFNKLKEADVAVEVTADPEAPPANPVGVQPHLAG